MEPMTDAVNSVARAGMTKILGKLTKNRFAAAHPGNVVMAVIHSLSATSVLVVTFAAAGSMTLRQSAEVITLTTHLSLMIPRPNDGNWKLQHTAEEPIVQVGATGDDYHSPWIPSARALVEADMLLADPRRAKEQPT